MTVNPKSMTRATPWIHPLPMRRARREDAPSVVAADDMRLPPCISGDGGCLPRRHSHRTSLAEHCGGTIRDFSVDITTDRSHFLRFSPSVFNVWNDVTTGIPPILTSLMFLI